MKKIAFVLTFFVAIFLSSCTDEGNDLGTVLESDLVGSWKVTSIYTEGGKISKVVNGVTVSANYSIVGKDYNLDVTFNENPQKATSQGSVTFIASYTFGGKTETEEIPNEAPLSSGDWNLKNNIVTITDEEGSSSSNIVALDKSSITFRQSLNKKIEIEGEELNMSGYIYMVLSK